MVTRRRGNKGIRLSFKREGWGAKNEGRGGGFFVEECGQK